MKLDNNTIKFDGIREIRAGDKTAISWDEDSLKLHSPEAEIRRQRREHRGRIRDCVVIIVPVEDDEVND